MGGRKILDIRRQLWTWSVAYWFQSPLSTYRWHLASRSNQRTNTFTKSNIIYESVLIFAFRSGNKKWEKKPYEFIRKSQIKDSLWLMLYLKVRWRKTFDIYFFIRIFIIFESKRRERMKLNKKIYSVKTIILNLISCSEWVADSECPMNYASSTLGDINNNKKFWTLYCLRFPFIQPSNQLIILHPLRLWIWEFNVIRKNYNSTMFHYRKPWKKTKTYF